MRVGIVAKHESDRALGLVEALARRLAAESVSVGIDERTRSALEARTDAGDPPEGIAIEELAACDLAVSVGGDGTFLSASRGAGTTPVLGVNVGEVGFLNAVDPAAAVEETLSTVATLRETGASPVMSVPRLAASGPDWALEPAANDVVVQGARRGHGGGIEVTVTVDGTRYTGGRADGVLVATPVGSTAYNLSEGGPLVHHGVEGLVVTVMAGDGLRPPLVVGADSVVTLEVREAPEAVVVGDGRVRQPVTPPATVTVERATDPLNVAEPSLDFFSALAKLD